MLNVVALTGRLVEDPELKTTGNGVSVCSIRLAVDRDYAPQGQERKADFINVVAWRGTAEFISKYFRKGQMIAVNGSIQTRQYEDRKGNKRTAVEVVAAGVSFCGSKSEQPGEKGNPKTYPAQTDPPLGGAQTPPQAYQRQEYEQQSFANAEPDDFSAVDFDDELPF